ncbi:Uncharacterised protein [Streptococcus pneumoniae]|nr:Uncharacterised protein [Streptococcus pneumoniae]
MCFTHSFFHFAILQKSLQTASTSNLFKPRPAYLTVGMVTDFVSSIYNLKTVF